MGKKALKESRLKNPLKKKLGFAYQSQPLSSVDPGNIKR